MSKREKKQKKKFQLDYISSIFLASFLFAIAYDCFKNNKGQGYFTANMIIGIILLLLSVLVVYRAIKDLIKKRREMILAEIERREKEAAEAKSEGDSDDADEGEKSDEDYDPEDIDEDSGLDEDSSESESEKE